MSKRGRGNGKKWSQEQNALKGRERNCSDFETEAYCTILADAEFSFSLTLESKALKKQANREVFEEIQMHLKTALEDPEFIEENNTYFEEAGQKDLDISIEKLRNKYNNLKKSWRQIVDRAKKGSGLHVEREPKWFQILHPVLSDTNSNLDEISSGPQDTSLNQQVQYSFFIRNLGLYMSSPLKKYETREDSVTRIFYKKPY